MTPCEACGLLSRFVPLRLTAAPRLTAAFYLLGAFGGFGTTTTTAAPAFSFSAPTNTGTSGK